MNIALLAPQFPLPPRRPIRFPLIVLVRPSSRPTSRPSLSPFTPTQYIMSRKKLAASDLLAQASGIVD